MKMMSISELQWIAGLCVMSFIALALVERAYPIANYYNFYYTGLPTIALFFLSLSLSLCAFVAFTYLKVASFFGAFT